MSHQCLLVAIVVFITTEAFSGTEVVKAVGDEVSFSPDKPLPASVFSITWKHIKDGETVKAIEWEDGETQTPNLRFNGITTLDMKTGKITITKLTVEHSGVYTIDISGKEQAQRFTLTVMERVPKPVIKIEPSGNPDVVYLICEYSETIIWKNSAGETLTGSAHHPKGESITVTKEGDPEIFYTCTLQNAASEETSERVYERDLFKGTNVVKAVGDEVSFSPDNPPASVSSITWKHIKGGETVKAIEWEDGETQTPNLRFNGITTLDMKTGQITITKLTVEHSGVYTIDISGKEQEQRFTLTVMEWVPEPVIKIEPSGNPDVVYLICEYGETIIWKNSAGETLTGSARQPKGESITVRKEGNPEIFYTCTLQNTASEETSERVYERDLFKVLNREFIIWIYIVVICLVFILLFLFIPPLYGSCAARCGRQKTSRK